MPKVLLVRPPQQFLFGVWPRGPRLSIPIGLLAIGSFLKCSDVDVEIYDAFVEGDDFDGNALRTARRFKHARQSSSLLNRWIARFEASRSTSANNSSSGTQNLHFGASWERIEDDIRRLKPDIIGITNLFRENSAQVIQMAKLSKRLLPEALIVVGGPNANALPQNVLDECPEIDIVGLGDGENLMLNVSKYYDGEISISSVPNLVYRSPNGTITRTESVDYPMNLDEYGALDYSLIHLERYFEYERNGLLARNKYVYPDSERAVSMVTSRGCPYACTFCSIHIHSGKKFRRHSVAYLLSQIRHLVEECGVKHIHFEDDNLTLDQPRFELLLREIIRHGIKFTWDTPNGVFVESLDENMMKLMKEAGCIYIIVGVESGDQWVLDNIVRKQPLKLTSVLDLFEAAKRVELDVHAFYIIGFPRETKEQIGRTLDFALDALKSYEVIPHLALARADPGTELFREAVATNTLARDVPISNAANVRADTFDRHLISTSEFSPDDLEKLNEDFHQECIKYLFRSRLVLLAKRPRDFCSVVTEILADVIWRSMSFRESIVKVFWCKLLYVNAMITKPYK